MPRVLETIFLIAGRESFVRRKVSYLARSSGSAECAANGSSASRSSRWSESSSALSPPLTTSVILIRVKHVRKFWLFGMWSVAKRWLNTTQQLSKLAETPVATAPGSFASRHIGPGPAQIAEMCAVVGVVF